MSAGAAGLRFSRVPRVVCDLPRVSWTVILSLLRGLLLRFVGVVHLVGWTVADRGVKPSWIVTGVDEPGNVAR